jgi:hypothetical protein
MADIILHRVLNRFNFKRFVGYCVLLPTFFLTVGCAYTMAPIQGILYTGIKTPVTYESAKDNKSYKVLGVTSGESQGRSILGLVAYGDAGVDAAYKAALAKYPTADGLVDVRVDNKYFSVLGLYATYTTILTAKAIKWTNRLGGTSTNEDTSINTAAVVDHASVSHTQHSLMLSYNDDVSDKMSGLMYGYKFRQYGKPLSLSLAVSFEYVSHKERDYGDASYKIKRKMIPVDIDVAVNREAIPGLANMLPKAFCPYIEAGLSYYIWNSGSDWTYNYGGSSHTTSSESPVDWFELGANLGVGFDCAVTKNVCVTTGVKRYFLFTNQDYKMSFLSWQLGLTFRPGA